MTIALMITDRDLSQLVSGLKALLPEVEVKCWPELTNDADIAFAVAWRHPKEMWQQLPNLKVVSSLGAGVDKLINDPNRPNHVRITRVVDKGLSNQMAEYVLTCMLMHKRRMLDFIHAQARKKWIFEPRLTGKKVTILGAGEIGLAVAERLHINGYQVSTWSQSVKHQHFIEKSYTGKESLLASVENADFIVSVLPATEHTTNLLNADVFEHMPNHSYLINVGRGNVINEIDLVNALEKHTIAGATLDVFKQEPLTINHPFWCCKNLTITPHISAITDNHAVVKQIAENYQRFIAKKPLKHQVNLQNGY